MRRNIINFGLFQILWFACILGAAHSILWPCILLFLGFAIWQLSPSNRHPGDFRLMLICLATGLIVDSGWVQLGIIQYQAAIPTPEFSPIWILILWMGMALTLNHSLAWLKKRLWLAAVFAAVASPLSYYAGSSLGAALVLQDWFTASLVFGLSWAVIVPLLLYFADNWSIVPLAASDGLLVGKSNT